MFSGTTNGLGYLADGASGTPRWEYDSGTGFPITGGSVVGDLDGDGKVDVLFCVKNGYTAPNVYAVGSASGKKIWDVAVGNANASTVVLGMPDLDADGKPDVVVGASGYGVVALSGADPTKQLWTYVFNAAASELQRVVDAGDLNGDGVPEVLVASSCAGICPGGDGVRVLNGKTGDLLWKGTAATATTHVDAVDDVDGDGRREVTEGEGQAASKGNTRLYSGATGKKLWEYAPGGGRVRSLRGAPDLDGDGRPDVVVGLDGPGRVVLLSGCPAP